ncbi:MAG: GreA/GreB family elongation factor [Candidatus Daviesbacteria bacterium]|nr:GreA/GreB family elongation factor [Candidatus Daviesbacteria bacterium]
MKESNPIELKPFFVTEVLLSELNERLIKVRSQINNYFPEEYKQAAHSDWRENSPKDALDHAWSLTKAELINLEDRISRAFVVDNLEGDFKKVKPGVEVMVTDMNGNQDSFVLLSVTNLKEKYLSIESPLGKSLVGKMKNETVRIIGADGKEQSFTIDGIRKPNFKQSLHKKDDSLERQVIISAPKLLDKNSSTVGQRRSSRIDAIKDKSLEFKLIQNGLSGVSPKNSLSEKTKAKDEKPLEAMVHRAITMFDEVVAKLEKQNIPFEREEKKRTFLTGGGSQIEEIIEFTIAGSRLRLQKISRPKIISVSQYYTKRSGSDQTNIIYSKTENDVLLKYFKLISGRWVEVDYRI